MSSSNRLPIQLRQAIFSLILIPVIFIPSISQADFLDITIQRNNCNPASPEDFSINVPPMGISQEVWDGMDPEVKQAFQPCGSSDIGLMPGQTPFAIKVQVDFGILKQSGSIQIGQSKDYLTIPGLSTPLRLTFEQEGDKGCLYLVARDSGFDFPFPYAKIKKSGIYYDSVDEVTFDAESQADPSTGALRKPSEDTWYWGLDGNCVFLPEPDYLHKRIDWGPYISPACLGEESVSNFRWPNGDSRSLLGKFALCIEDTVGRIFTGNLPELKDRSMFTMIQDRLKQTVFAIISLYIIMLGYRFIVTPGKISENIKQNEWFWIVLKIALVMYFATGPGMQQVFPALQSFTKETSAIVMEAGIGLQLDEKAKEHVNTLREDYRLKLDKLSESRLDLRQDPTDPALIAVRDEAMEEAATAKEALESAKLEIDSQGYDYCDFREVPYPPNDFDHLSTQTFMKVWDIIDCKVSKYLGLGDSSLTVTTPNFIWGIFVSFAVPITALAVTLTAAAVATGMLESLVAAAIWIAPAITGLIIIILGILFLVFLFLIVLRIAHMFLLSFMAIVILVYISPLVIPAVLFQKTNSIFKKWLQFMMAYSVQPILLCAILAFVFSIFDTVYFGQNYRFVPIDNIATPSKHAHRICMKTEDNVDVCTAEDFAEYKLYDLHCDDKEAIPCIFMGNLYQIDGFFKNFSMTALLSSPIDFTVTNGLVLVGLLQLVFIAFLIHTSLKTMEEIVGAITNAQTMAGMTFVPTQGVDDILDVGVTGSEKMYSTGKQAAKMGAKVAKKAGSEAAEMGSKQLTDLVT